MKNLNLLKFFGIIILSCFLLTNCNTKEKTKKTNLSEKIDVVEITTNIMDFNTLDTIKSGWHIFRYINNSAETHFFLLDKYPEGVTIENAEKEVAPVFQEGMYLINEGKPEEGFKEFQKLPEWFYNVVFTGGSGLVSPGKKSETTLYIEPGYYVIECYVKMANGVFHSSMGMVKQLIVEGKGKDSIQISPNAKITISSTNGIICNDTIKKGKQTFSVYFEDQKTYENFVGHDVNLVKIESDSIQKLENWMNWANPKGLINPSPEGFTFLGGVNDMPTGSTAYFTANLNEGTYALISEVPNPSTKNLLKIFTVSN